MERIGVGNTAEVYAYKEGKVCKLFYIGYPHHLAHLEFKNSRLINHLGIPSPKAYELIEQDGRYGILYDRLYGENMLTLLLSQPNTSELFVKMVAFQQQMLDKHTEACMDYKDFMRGLLKGKKVDPKVYQEIDQLPDGDNLCHGDYHPGNVWVDHKGDLAVIDFMNICHGPKAYDIARTYYLIAHGSMPAGISEEEKEKIIKLQHLLGQQYLELMKVKREQIQNYIDIIALCRCYEF